MRVTDPSPGLRRLVKTLAQSTLSPSERAGPRSRERESLRKGERASGRKRDTATLILGREGYELMEKL